MHSKYSHSSRTTILLIFLIFLLSGIAYGVKLPDPVAQKGVLDLSNSQLNNGVNYQLLGEWEFYWKQLLTPADFTNTNLKPKHFIESGFWNLLKIDGKELGSEGYATYRLKLLLPDTSSILALQLPLMHTNYKLWINNNVVSQNGTVGTTIEKSIPEYLPRTVNFYPKGKNIELVLQISNFHHVNGGIWQPISIGTDRAIKIQEHRQIGFDLFMIGSIFIMAIYHFGLYILRRAERSTIAFGMFSLVIAFRMSIHGYQIFNSVFPGISWEILTRLDYFTLYFGLGYFLIFIRLLYPNEFSVRFYQVAIFISVLYVLFTTFAPTIVFTGYLVYYQILIAISGIYFIYALIMAIRHDREGAKFVLGGFIVLFLSFINDVLYNHEIIHTLDLMGAGLFIFIFSQSFVLSLRFSKAFHTIEIMSRELEHKVRERTASIKDLLDNSGQGFFSFARNYKVQEMASHATEVFFKQNIENEDALSLMYPGQETEQKESLDLVFDDPGCMDMIRNIIPPELSRENKIYNVDYHWIKPRDNQEGRIMVVMTDITAQRTLEQKLADDEALSQMIVKVAVDRDGFLKFLNDAEAIQKSILDNLEAPVEQVDSAALFRYFHTLKGGMASYAFEDVANQAHAIEERLAKIQSGQTKFTASDIKTIRFETEQMQSILLKTLDKLSFLLPKELLETSSTTYFRISESKIALLEEGLADISKSNPSIKFLINNLRRQPVRNILKKYANSATELAKRLNKKLEVQILGDETEILHKPFSNLFSVLIHLIRNSVDHGIEEPADRIMLGKPESGQLKIKINHSQDGLIIEIEDDGAGVNLDKIKAKAIEKGIYSKDDIEKADDETIRALIFSPAFSTSEKVSRVSGRGVGLDAVKDEVEKLGGEIRINSRTGEGTVFTVSIPAVDNF